MSGGWGAGGVRANDEEVAVNLLPNLLKMFCFCSLILLTRVLYY